ncbi:hypothetical protein L1987_23190 [Smallanthus sonchifolius]|uniref:Uncharacterized protein n=1 Tax=Smallanthus sonchifolius TaxID=185202 RepID=A0ACB9IIE5_9ASTR|nr:hypothetical protein L1987_23190 [Smallanthus sonchifolius]
MMQKDMGRKRLKKVILLMILDLEDDMAEVSASWLSSTIEDELRKKEIEILKMEIKNVKRVYMKRKTPSITTSEVTKPAPEELVEELSRKTIEDILSQDYHDEVNAQIKLEDNMAEVVASWLSSITEDELRKKEIERLKMEIKNVKRVYMKRKTHCINT